MKTINNFKNKSDFDLYSSIYNFIEKNYKLDPDSIDKIYDKIVYNTNENLNFDYGCYDYNDKFDDKIIGGFLENNIGKYNTIDDVKIGFSDYIYDKFYDNRGYFDILDYDLNDLGNDIKDLIDDYHGLLNDLRDNFGILELDIDIKSFLDDEYKIALYTKDPESDITIDCYNFSTNKKYIKDDIKKCNIFQKICKKNGFNLKSIFDYINDNKNNKSYRKSEKLYNTNNTFKTIFDEFCNDAGYGSYLCNILYLNIDDIFNFCLKDSDFNFGYYGSLGFYEGCNGSGSLFGIELKNPLKVKCSDLIINMYNNTNIESVYGFTNEAFY